LPTIADLFHQTNSVVKGPSPFFDKAHLLLAFLTIGDEGSVGRQALAKKTGLGEGSIRTILKRLREEGYVVTGVGGGELTDRGRKLHNTLRNTLSSFIKAGESQMTLGRIQVAVAVRGVSAKVRNGIEQRDSAIKVGASGATTYAIAGGKFSIPGGSTDCEKDFPDESWFMLRKGLTPKNGDAVIVCGADEEMTADLGALAAAITLF
jgi:biotin operon repressor